MRSPLRWGGSRRPRRARRRAAHLEHVGEVGAHAQLEPELDRPPQMIGDDQLLDERAVEQLLAPHVQEVLRIVEETAELAIGQRQIDL